MAEWFIDSDAHITEPGDLWTSRLPAKYRDLGPKLIRNPDTGVDIWQIGDSNPLVPVGHTAVAGWKDPFPAAPLNMDEVPPAAYEPKARLNYLDSIGAWAQVMYPNVGGFGNQAFLDLNDRGLMLACVQAYNDFLTEWTGTDPRRLIAVTAMPFWDVPACVEEIDRCAKMGHKGILFSGEPHNLGMPLLGDPHWNPIWEKAQDLGLPISFHIGSAKFDEGFSEERFRVDGMGASLGKITVGLFLNNAQQIVDLLLCGVLPRYPELKFISVESGIGFIPFLLEALDHTFHYSRMRAERPEFELLPSEYFRRQVYACYWFEENAPQRLVDKIGEDNILFETDYPHPVCLYGNVREQIDAGLKGQTPEIRHKLLWENAARLYGIAEPDRPVPAL